LKPRVTETIQQGVIIILYSLKLRVMETIQLEVITAMQRVR
jgi:hypothetical protein